MKEVNIENVRERINEIELWRGTNDLRISLREEFELACLRQLLEMMQSVQVLPSGWRMVPTEPQPALVVPDKMTAIVKDEAEYVEGWNDCRAAMLNQAQEPATDNTAQQFEALATSAQPEIIGYEHRLICGELRRVPKFKDTRK